MDPSPLDLAVKQCRKHLEEAAAGSPRHSYLQQLLELLEMDDADFDGVAPDAVYVPVRVRSVT